MPHMSAPDIRLHETKLPPLTESLISDIKIPKLPIHINCIWKFISHVTEKAGRRE